MLEAQNRRIDDLVERIKLQQEKLDKQNVRIRTLQSQVRKQLRIQRKRFCIPHQNKFFLLVFYYFFIFSAISLLTLNLFPGATVKTEQQH